eukprot:UN09083
MMAVMSNNYGKKRKSNKSNKSKKKKNYKSPVYQSKSIPSSQRTSCTPPLNPRKRNSNKKPKTRTYYRPRPKPKNRMVYAQSAPSSPFVWENNYDPLSRRVSSNSNNVDINQIRNIVGSQNYMKNGNVYQK